MIQVHRGLPPQTLSQARDKHLPDAIATWLRHGHGRALRDTLTGYDVTNVRDTLYQRQHKKCAFCENRVGLANQPIEHFRPRKGAWRNLPGQPREEDPNRYWWLTWEWENLLFSCSRCNSTSRKGNYFPLAPHTLPLSPLSCTQPMEEDALLLDPADPELVVHQHMRWQPLDRNMAQPRWEWTLRPRSPRGYATCMILQLEYRTDEVTDRYREVVWPRVRNEVYPPARDGDTPAACHAWDSAQRELISPLKPMTFATWCMFDELRRQDPVLQHISLPLSEL